ncbi:MAG: hypothetical protein JWM12_2828, partial [Ilumatobacteraceae bacterium]|nr:hypothetical protein [Ilumatobacteraceae bacterium]
MTLQVRRSQPGDTDETLTLLARDGDDDAFAELYRRHLRAAKTTARCICRSRDDVEDVVAEAFTGVLNAMRNGRGPTDNFRAYLLACVRNGCYVRRRPPTPVDTTQVEAASGAALEDPERYVEADTVARAFSSLSPRWQRTLWLTEVEQRPASEVARELELAPNATAALSRRARQAFAEAYLTQHVTEATGVGCASVVPRLGAYVRDNLRPTERAEIEQHLARCNECSRAVDELGDLNASLRSLQGPIAAAGAGAATVGTGVALTSAAVGGTWAALLGAGALVKVAAVALIAVPTVAYGINRGLQDHPDPRPQATVTLIVAAPPNGTTASGRGTFASAVDPAATTIVTNAGGGSSGTSGGSVDGAAIGAAVGELPGLELPDVAAPDGAAPGVERPGVPVAVTVASDGVSPSVAALPGATVAGATVPGATVPVATVPVATVLAVGVPGATVPAAGVSLPSFSIPPVQAPA